MKIFHFCLDSPVGNFGDDILFYSVKKTFDAIYERDNNDSITWMNYNLRSHTTEAVIEKANSCDLIIVGGGGLLLKDTAPNSWSGWQWAIHSEHLKKIKKPLIVYAIGYNRFRNQEDFSSHFLPHIKMTLDKAAFFSVRNHGSKNALTNYGLDENKIAFQPCPALFYTQAAKDLPSLEGSHIGINLAGDRNNLRYDKNEFYQNMIRVLKNLTKKGHSLHFFNHNWNPDSNCQDLINLFPEASIHNIETVWDYHDIISAVRYYRSMDLVISMRYHGVLVPFGQRKKVIPLITHDKLKWFLEDAKMLDTGVDINQPHFSDMLISKVDEILSDTTYYKRQDEALLYFKKNFDENNEKIWKSIL